MNPPETNPKKKFCLTFEVSEGRSAGNIVSFDPVSLSILSSISSGALADHSSLSESSESLHHLPGHSSTSTNSSGLSASRTVKRQLKPCQCCSILNYLKLQCVCGQGNLLFVRDVSSKEGVDAKEGARHPEACSDMDLTDPVITVRTSLPADVVTPTEEQPSSTEEQPPTEEEPSPTEEEPSPTKEQPSPTKEQPSPIEEQPSPTEEQPSSTDEQPSPTEEPSQAFPRIRLSIRPECIIPMAAEDSEEEVEEEEETFWRFPSWEQLMPFFYELPVSLRPLDVPSHFKEDKRSRFLTMLWVGRMLHAYNTGSEPPVGVTRIYYDPRVDPELPRDIYTLLEKFSDDEIINITQTFDDVCDIAKRASGGDQDYVQSANDPTHSRWCPQNDPKVNEVSNPDQFDQTCEFERAENTTAAEVNEVNIPDQPDQTCKFERAENTTAAEVNEVNIPDQPDQTCKFERAENTTAEDGAAGKYTLVYAKFGTWYYPAVMECSMEEWDSTIQPITVWFYDGSLSKKLPPDTMLPLQRLRPGTGIQLQVENSLYDDVIYLSFSSSVSDTGMVSAVIEIRKDDGQSEDIPFSRTALSGKDVVRIRAGLKDSFYPKRSRKNFTVLSTGAILEHSTRRARAAVPADGREKKVQSVPSKRKQDVEKPSSSSTTTPSSRKRPRLLEEISTTPSSSTERLLTSSEEPVSKTYRCTAPGCGMLFDSVQELLQHRDRIMRDRKRMHTTMEPADKAYLCTAPGCGKLFDSEQELLQHRDKIKRDRKRRHTTMEVVSRSQYKQLSSSNVVPKKVNIAGPSGASRSRYASLQLPRSLTSSFSDSETDAASSFCTSWRRGCVQGRGLSAEKCKLSDKVKSFKKIKGENKTRCPPQTNLFASQHFILTKGCPPTFKKPRKRTADSESDSTDVENYYSTSLEFEVLKLQEAIECGGGHLYTDFMDVPDELRQSPGYDLVVISSHPTCTANYIYGVALGCTTIRHDTIFDCIKKRVSLRDALSSGSAVLLPPGWCKHKMTWAEPRASRVEPFKDLKFFVVLRTNQESKSFWCSLIKHLGGKSILLGESHQVYARLDKTIKYVVVDPIVPLGLACQAKKLDIPIVNTAWIIQAVITGSKPPTSSYEVTTDESSS